MKWTDRLFDWLFRNSLPMSGTIFVLSTLFIVLEFAPSSAVEVNGVVLERYHANATWNTGFTSDGKAVYTSTAASWDLVVQSDDGYVVSVQTNPVTWALAARGSAVTLRRRTGFLTRSYYHTLARTADREGE